MMPFVARRFIFRVVLFIVILLLAVSFLLTKSPKSREKTDKDLNLKKKRNLSKNEVDLVIVEEHHEVLEYWFKAAREGIIPKSGNILLHIDAHSDMAPPDNVEGYPFFRWPKNKDEIRTMIQSNDVFIQAAAMIGFFKKVIWVWPSWDEVAHDGGSDMTRMFGGGWTTVTFDGQSEKVFCECEYKKDGVTRNVCQFVNRSALANDEYDGSKIDPKKCMIKGKIELQETVDYIALQRMISGSLVNEEESLLLDIDEDFFGCVLRGKSLVDVGIPWNAVEEIDDLLNEIVCPQVIEHEELGNELMQMVLTLIIKKCQKNKKLSKACVTPQHPVKKDLTSMLSRIARLFINKQIFCEMEQGVLDQRMDLLVERLLRLDIKQLKSFIDIGFCMQTTPRAYESSGFQLCHGANEPNATVVTVHMPDENEVKLRLSRLRRIIQAKTYPTPKMVTLCRSVRDGYTPVPHFQHIEKDIIKSIQTSRPGVKYKVVYDVNLLGGKKGWPSRQKKYSLPNLARMKRNIRKTKL